MTPHGRACSGLRMLFYHRVSRDHDELAVTPERFERQMDELAERGWSVVDAVSAMRLMEQGDDDGTIGLCFDDGYADIAEHALPVLERHGFSATVFLPTGVIDGTATFSWYDEQPPMLDWRTIRRLDQGPTLRFGAHTITHPSLLELSDDQAWEEIAGSKWMLEAHLGRTVDAFCYPAGLFGERERDMVDEAGYTLATSCEPGVNSGETDRLALRRLQIGPRDRAIDFRAKVGGGHDAPSALRSAFRRRRYGVDLSPNGSLSR